MRDRLRYGMRTTLNFLRRTSDDLGTVCLGAAAIFLVRAFPASVCDKCQELDEWMVFASGVFLALGLVLRYVSKAESE